MLIVTMSERRNMAVIRLVRTMKWSSENNEVENDNDYIEDVDDEESLVSLHANESSLFIRQIEFLCLIVQL
jgi:hypothetical protein